MTSRVSDGANPDCIGCSTIITESNSCVRQDEAVAPQQEDNGRCGRSRDSAGSNHIINLACALMKCIPNSDKITTITNLIDSPNIMLAS